MVKKSYSVSLEADLVESLQTDEAFSLSVYLQGLMTAQVKTDEEHEKEVDEKEIDGDDGVAVYGEDGLEIVATVAYNENLDFWDGRNYTCGSTGRHKGLARLRSGEYVMIEGTQWQGERTMACVVSAEDALQAVLRSGNTDLLDEPRFADLKKLKSRTMKAEWE